MANRTPRGVRGGRPRAAKRMPPDGRLRLSQVTSSFGAGSLVDLVDDAVLIGGLDFWRMPEGGEAIEEPRLREAVGSMMNKLKRPLSIDRPFLRAPAGDEDNPNEAVGIQALEFPTWFVCQNPKCRALVRAGQLTWKTNRYLHDCDSGARAQERCVPVRFVSACEKGHLDDIDWPRWAHDGADCGSARLRFDEGVSGDFGEVVVRCLSCEKSRYLVDFLAEEKRPFCRGTRPWLGNEGRESCEKTKARLLVRSASNTYFAQTMSALSIPMPPSAIAAVKTVWDVLEAATRETLVVLKTIPKVKQALAAYDDEEVWRAVTDVRENRDEALPELRTAEFEHFMRQPAEVAGEMPSSDRRKEAFWARSIRTDGPLPAGVGRVVVARRLREVVAQIGFTRLEPASVDLQGNYDLDVASAPLSLQRDWLPASEIQGEGIFIQLDEAAVRTWETRPAVVARLKSIEQGFSSWRTAHGSKMEFVGGRFYLLHSLAHLLMNALALECGYPSSAIKERIYCAPHNAPTPMAALLLSTGTSGVEGTLGGLVEEGRRIGEHLTRAVREARLCSNDPVCAQHRPGDASERYLEGAACHGCLFVAECSCERFNQFLDRALVASSLGLEGVAFFGDIR